MNQVQACRNVLLGKCASGRPAHSGLLLDRLLETQGLPAARTSLLQATLTAQSNAVALYVEAFRQRLAWIESLRALNVDGHARWCVRDFRLPAAGGSRIVLGLGGESALETGLTLHRTYGTPIVPASALKGLSAHFTNELASRLDKQNELRKSLQVEDAEGKPQRRTGFQYRAVFGDQKESGSILFLDAWFDPSSSADIGLLHDVMTPHHQDYYGGKRDSGGHVIPPTDFDGPNPVQFLSVRGTFHFALYCENISPTAGEWLDWTVDLLREALRLRGVGGKTSSGYGRFEEPVPDIAKPSGKAAPEATARLVTGEFVEAELLEEKTKGGGWKVRAVATGGVGHIVNTDKVPGDKKPGDRLMLKVASPIPSFQYLTDEERARSQGKKRR